MKQSLHTRPVYTRTTSRSEHQTNTPQQNCLVTLQPIVKRIPNSLNVYFPSKLRPKKEISYADFLSRYAQNPKGIHVCFEEAPSIDEMIQKSKYATAYNFGLDCWYILESIGVEDNMLRG